MFVHVFVCVGSLERSKVCVGGCVVECFSLEVAYLTSVQFSSNYNNTEWVLLREWFVVSDFHGFYLVQVLMLLYVGVHLRGEKAGQPKMLGRGRPK